MDNSLLIHKYFKNSLSENEEITFNKLLNEDEDFKKTFEEHQSLHRAFEINEAERLKHILIAHENSNLSKPSISLKPYFYAIAASVLILLGTSIYYSFFQQDLYDKYFEPYPNVYQPAVRGNIQENNNAFVYYENQNYIKAQDAFEELLSEDDNPSLRFYFGLSYLNNNQTEKAISEFNRIKNTDFEFKAELYWYMALAQLKLKNKNEAKNFLENLKTHFPDFKTDGVKDLLNSL